MQNSRITHLLALMDEVTYLKTQTRESDTGHIFTTIRTLESRINKLRKEIEQDNEDAA
tara:strand:+ start:1704 stop:1877 length:174 start_codon:yes stop_codon:yes gene_type:complete